MTFFRDPAGPVPGNKRPTFPVFGRIGCKTMLSLWPVRSMLMNMSRRDFVVTTSLAAALGLNARLVSPAFAQKTPDPAKGFVTYKIGDAEVTALYDGIWEKPHDPAFIVNASVDDVKGAMA